MVAELRRVLQAPQVETPPGWDLQEIAPTLAAGGEAGVTVGDDVGAPPPADGEAASIPATDCVASKEAVNQKTTGKNQKKKAVPQKRNKAVPWSEVEHKLFLEGIRKHGTGGWKRLAREFVVTRSAGQIASHYQKYSIRQAKRRRNECKRPSIHDIDHDGTTGAAADHGSNQQPVAADGEPESGTTDDVSAGEEEAANYR
ncbi:hypothetical protein BRADI_3g44143v3 [Brachypodium distachyon]|uniref:Uncharacterized protein n=2 Tax=Brachypodium distachyon TaxID=15368 RepID=A0A2K2D310_BRADI|nr:hypothetical protein BRADI_3g44143v3 [Brachypodium distachyon]